MIAVHTGQPLAQLRGVNPLMASWLAGGGGDGDAAADLARVFAPVTNAQAAAPIWRDEAWLEAWTDRTREDLAVLGQEEVLGSLGDRIAALGAGAADVVITGQQPGWLGGPLYTLFKVATTVVLAELRSAAGRPTQPVFWSGDDDDDLAEALRPVLFDPARETLLHAEAMPDRQAPAAERTSMSEVATPGSDGGGQLGAVVGSPLGARLAAEFEQGSATWLTEQAGRGGLTAALSDLWSQAVRDRWSWAELQRRALLQLFAPAGLLIVSGDDPALHAAAAEFYASVWQERTRWSAAVTRGARQFEAASQRPALSRAATERFLFEREKEGRRKLATTAGTALPAPERLRPGVALRAAIQDWLFRPAAVVVGPGEVAYLTQLAAAYTEWSLPRAPLVPRLFAHLVPAEYRAQHKETKAHPGGRSAARGVDNDRNQRLAAVAARAVAPLRARIADALATEIGVPRRRADKLAGERTAAWERAVTELLERERDRKRLTGAQQWPAWVEPGGDRQERRLAVHCATALWGDDVVAAVLHAARRHIDAGLDGHWQEFLLEVPSP